MTWTTALCEAVDDANRRCVLPLGHTGLHDTGAPKQTEQQRLRFFLGALVLTALFVVFFLWVFGWL